MLRESILPFLLGVGIVTFLFVIDFIFDYLSLILSKGVPAPVVLELFILALGWITALSIPVGALVAALMVFGRLAQDNEVTALRGLGVSAFRLFRVPLLGAFFVSLGLTAFNNWLLPEANHRFVDLTSAIARKSPAAHITPGVFVESFDNYSLLVQEVDSKAGNLRDITIYDYSEGQVPTTILAEQGHMEFQDDGATLKLELENGVIHVVPGEIFEDKYRRMQFDKQTLYLHDTSATLRRQDRHARGEREMSIPRLLQEADRQGQRRKERLQQIDQRVQKSGYRSYQAFAAEYDYVPNPAGWRRLLKLVKTPPPPQEKDIAELLTAVQRDQVEVDRITRRRDEYLVEVHKKFSIPFACIVFVFLGGSLGLRMAKRGFANMATAVACFMVFYLLLLGGEQLAERQLVSPGLAMWFPDLFLGAIGILLTLGIAGKGPSRGMR